MPFILGPAPLQFQLMGQWRWQRLRITNGREQFFGQFHSLEVREFLEIRNGGHAHAQRIPSTALKCKRTRRTRRFGQDILEATGKMCDDADVNDRISISATVCHGQACIRGTRIPVHQIVRMFAHGDSVETLLGAYPSITREDITACLEYAASLAEEQVTPLGQVVLAP
jgi:uncharacterized protein (DUF433 family)